MLSLSFLKSHRKEGGALLRSFVFITEGEVLTAETIVKCIWTHVKFLP